MDFQPLNEGIMVEPIDSSRTAGGITVLNPSKTFKHLEGTVVAVSPGETRVALEERVMFYPNSGLKTSVNGKDVCILKVTELLGVYRNA